MATSLLYGSSMLLKTEKIDLEKVISRVTSKGGTTEKAIEYFNKNNQFFKIINSGIKLAENRSSEISKMIDNKF